MLYESVIKNQRQYFFRIILGMIFLIFIILIWGCGAGDNENSDNTAKKLTSKASTVEKFNKLHFIIENKTKIRQQSDLMINIYSEKISAVEQLIIKLKNLKTKKTEKILN